MRVGSAILSSSGIYPEMGSRCNLFDSDINSNISTVV